MWLIYKKELLELIRDKKTLIFSILLPTVIVPLFMFGFVKFAAKKDKDTKEEVIDIAIINEQRLPGLSSVFTREKNFEKKNIDSKEYKDLVTSNEVDFIIQIPDQVSAPDISQQQEEITVYHRGSSNLDSIKFNRVKSAIDVYNSNMRKALGERFGLSNKNVIAFKKPIKIVETNFASKREKTGEVIGSLIAYILILLAVSGAMYPAMELGVGEKERGTLETLLLTPMPKWRIITAKFAVLFTTSFLSIILVLLSYFVWSMLLGFGTLAKEKGFAEVMSSISGVDLTLIGLLLLPVTAIFASLMLVASIYAKNMKEAQAYMSPIMMFAFFPVLIALLPGMNLNWQTATIPITNVSLAMKDLLKGTVDYNLLSVIFISTTIIAAGLLYFTTQFFKKEKVLFRS